MQLQREELAEAPRLHRPSGEATELGGQLLRGSICHPHSGPPSYGNACVERNHMTY